MEMSCYACLPAGRCISFPWSLKEQLKDFFSINFSLFNSIINLWFIWGSVFVGRLSQWAFHWFLLKVTPFYFSYNRVEILPRAMGYALRDQPIFLRFHIFHGLCYIWLHINTGTPHCPKRNFNEQGYSWAMEIKRKDLHAVMQAKN